MGSLDGRVVIVTGASKGIGREYAILLAAEGAQVVVNNRASAGLDSSASAQSVVDEIVAAGGSAIANTEDVTDWDGAARLIRSAVDAFGTLHVLVNNAGFLWDGDLVSMTEEQWDSVVTVHLKGHFAPLRAAVKYWTESGADLAQLRPMIVNTSSGVGLWGLRGCINYATAKGGVLSMTACAAQELEPLGIRVNCVAPAGRTRWQERPDSVAYIARDLMRPPSDGTSFDAFDAANTAPALAWLCQADCPVTGQVLRTVGGSVKIMEGWRIAASVDRDSRWTVPELNESLKDVRWPVSTTTFAATAAR